MGRVVIDAVIETMGLSVHVLLVKRRVIGWDSARMSPEKMNTVSGGAEVNVWELTVKFGLGTVVV